MLKKGVRLEEERLRPATKLAYGAGELGPAMASSTMIFFQMIFLTNVAGLQPALAGSVLLVTRVWDAFNDPLIGWLSDRTRSRLGRRLPWMIACAVPFGVFFMLFLLVPGFVDRESQWALFAYYVIIALLFSTFYTGMALPHSSLTPELSHDYDERSRITGFRMGFSLGGSVGGLVVALGVFEIMGRATVAAQYFAIGAIVAVIGVVSMGVCVFGIRRVAVERDRARLAAARAVPRRPSIPIRKQLAIIFSNKAFLLVCGIYLCSWMAMQFTATILPYYVEIWMGESRARFAMLALAVQSTALLLIPFWGWLSVRLGKKPVYFYGMIFWLAAQCGLMLLGRENTAWLLWLGILAGVGISVCYLIPNAMLPDIIELDELETGERREGVFYGFFVFLQKIALAVATFIVGQVLSLAGFLPAEAAGEVVPEQPDSALLAIRLAIGPLPAVAILLGMFFAARFPITREKHEQIRAELERRREGR